MRTFHMQTTAGASGSKCHKRRASGLVDQELLTSLGFWVLLVTEVVQAVPSWSSGHHSQLAVFRYPLPGERFITVSLASTGAVRADGCCDRCGLALWLGPESSEMSEEGILTCRASVRKKERERIPAKRLTVGTCFLTSPRMRMCFSVIEAQARVYLFYCSL